MGVIYFSYSNDDKEFVERIIKHAKDPDYESLNFFAAPLLDKWETDSISVMQNFILKSLKFCNRTIVLVGENTHKSKWVPVEVDLSLEFKKPVYAMRIQGTNGKIPECLIEHGIKVEDWNIEVLQYLATK